jgi:hypothetical protein
MNLKDKLKKNKREQTTVASAARIHVNDSIHHSFVHFASNDDEAMDYIPIASPATKGTAEKRTARPQESRISKSI